MAPPGLHVVEHRVDEHRVVEHRVVEHRVDEHRVVGHRPPAGTGAPPSGATPRLGAPVVLVHGSLDRGDSFRRVVRRLADLRVITYDRRGYQRSRHGEPPDGLGAHVDDLLGVVEAAGGGPAVAVGHSLGGDVVIAAALAEPGRFSAIGAYEPPMPWLGFRRKAPGAEEGRPSPAEDPGDAAERFFARMIGRAAWDRLPEDGRRGRRADGPALVADMRALRAEPPFDVTALSVPVAFGRGGPSSGDHHRDTVAWLAAHVPDACRIDIDGAGHGAHLSHPDAFADFVRAAVELGARRRDRSGGRSPRPGRCGDGGAAQAPAEAEAEAEAEETG